MKSFKKNVLYLVSIFLLFFLLIIFNQFIAFYNNIASINKWLAIFLLTLLIVIFLYMLILPIYSFIKYPRLPQKPKNENSREYDDYINIILTKLKNNKALKRNNYVFIGETNKDKVENAYEELKKISKEIIKKDAAGVFITTAISQNGVFDGASVLLTLLKMVYRVSTIYENRPSWPRLIYLYGQIATVVLLAATIEDMDIIERQLEPILASLLGGSFVSLVPGAMGVTTIVVNSIVEGSVNALFTLRVGIIAQRYLDASYESDKKQLRSGASIEATAYLASIIKDNANFIIKTFTNATKKATIDKIKWPWTKDFETN